MKIFKSILYTVVALLTTVTTPSFSMEMDESCSKSFNLPKNKVDLDIADKINFCYDDSFSAQQFIIKYCERLKSWLISEIVKNPHSKKLLELSLEKNKNLKIKFLYKEMKGIGSYTREDQLIKININNFRTFIFEQGSPPPPSDITDDQLNDNYQASMILHALIFELGNSITQLNEIRFCDFPDGKTFARALEIDEFETVILTHPIFDYGREYCKWNRIVFRSQDIDLVKERFYSAEDDHYYLYVSQYEEDWLTNTLNYYFYKYLCCYTNPKDE
jgi:hypothetical protein